MRAKRQRVFKVTIHGTTTGGGCNEWTEPAGPRSLYEFQHDLSTRNPGRAVRVQEQFLGGAKAKEVEEIEEEI